MVYTESVMKKVLGILIVATVFMGSVGTGFVLEANASGDGGGKGYLLHNRDNCPLNEETTCFPRLP
jgi:hypothetical protein